MRPTRWAWAEIDRRAVAHNVGVLRRTVAPAGVVAVVKANGYGHGAVAVGGAALAAGAQGLAVALTAEGVELRAAGVSAPILVLSEQPPEDAGTIVQHSLTPTVSTAGGVDALAAAAARHAGRALGVHLKLDTGMHRVGARPEDAPALAAHIAHHAPWLHLAGVYTHLAVADEPDDPYTGWQLGRFDEAVARLPAPPAVLHAANSAAALACPAGRRSFVRAGIAVYGISPGPGVDHLVGELRPALALKARVSFLKRLRAGDRISYGLRHTFCRDATVATVPIGYHDGVRRGLSPGQAVLIGGRRRPIVGAVTMDQLMVDCGDDPVAVGDEVVLIGRQGTEQVRAEEWAVRLGTIGYEVVCGIGARVERIVRSEDVSPGADEPAGHGPGAASSTR